MIRNAMCFQCQINFTIFLLVIFALQGCSLVPNVTRDVSYQNPERTLRSQKQIETDRFKSVLSKINFGCLAYEFSSGKVNKPDFWWDYLRLLAPGLSGRRLYFIYYSNAKSNTQSYRNALQSLYESFRLYFADSYGEKNPLAMIDYSQLCKKAPVLVFSVNGDVFHASGRRGVLRMKGDQIADKAKRTIIVVVGRKKY